MAKDAANNISYYLLLKQEHTNDLAAIRHWSNVKMATDAGMVWVKDLDYAQINSLEVKSMPYKTAFYEKDGKLFFQNSLLPDRNVPSVLWSYLERSLPITLPPFNHNFFGIQEQIEVHIVSSTEEREAVALMAQVAHVRPYLNIAPTVRMQKMTWVVLNESEVLLVGKPVLPIDGQTYWQRGNHFLPTGYDFDLYLLSDALALVIDREQQNFIVWGIDSSYFLINKNDLLPLSLSSFRLSTQNINT